MAIFKLESNNPLFSHALCKNPASGMLVKSYRKGHLFGYYSESQRFGADQQYNIVFKDSDVQVSFGSDDRDFEYLDTLRFNTPYIVLAAVTEYLNHISSSNPPEEDVEAEQVITLPFIEVSRELYLNKFQSFFQDVDLIWESLGANNYKIEIRTKSTLAWITDYAQLLALFLVLTNRNEDLYIQDSLIEKYIGILERLSAPYYMINLFKTHFLSKNRNMFSEYKERLESVCQEQVTLAYGGSHQARIDTITGILDLDGYLLDVGCGEGRYIHLCKKLPDEGKYIGIDTDESVIAQAQRKAKRKGWIDNILLTTSFDEAIESFPDPTDLPVEVILTEVIEHMPKLNAAYLISDILTKVPNLKRLVITVPNKDFNQFWDFEEDEMRHDDHDWEPTASEFEQFITSCCELSELDVQITFQGIGDVVNGHALSLLAIINEQI